jgi:Zn-dependent M28 family amino/carboxypeptidase
VRSFLATVAAAITLALALVGAATTANGAPVEPTQAGQRIPASAIREHLAAFQRIADRHGGTRAAATPGYDASARYVAMRMRKAGYAVRFQEFAFPFVHDRSPPVLRTVGSGAWDFRANRDYATFAYSGAGRVEADVVAVDLLVPSPRPNASTSGCETRDFAGFLRGSVALLQRGTCTFRVKVANAVAAGASAVVVSNEGNPGRRGVFAASLGTPQTSVPALAASFEIGEALRRGARDGPTGARVEVVADVVAETRRTRNVIAESRAGDARNLVVAGAHLDSVRAGPGINDNGSGSAVLLEVAERLAQTRPRNRLRFVWWGAEELGLIGSRQYVGRLTPQARRAHALYLNLDMVGSSNYVLSVYDGDGSLPDGVEPPPGSAAIERLLVGYLKTRKIPFRETQLGGSSDHASFAAVGIPIGGLFTGADGQKSQAEAATFGGRAGEPYDPCYHRACDTLANVNGTALSRAAQATAHVLRAFARSVATVRRSG